MQSAQVREALPNPPAFYPATAPTILPEPPKIQTPSQEAPEQIYNFIIVSRSKRFGRQEYLTGILTSKRLIFVPMTNDMLKEVTNISKQQAKGKLAPVIVYPYQQNYLAMAPSALMNQTPDCFAIENTSVREVKLSLVSVVGDGYADFEEFEIQLITDSGNQVFRMTKRDEYVSRLRQVHNDKVKLPPNYTLPR